MIQFYKWAFLLLMVASVLVLYFYSWNTIPLSRPQPRAFKNITVPETSPCHPDTFVNRLKSFQWEEWIASYSHLRENVTNFQHLTESLFEVLQAFLILPPVVEVNTSCTSPPLSFPESVPPCQNLSSGGRKIAMLLTLGFDVDTLEIHFQELDDVVDKFFLLEATTTYFLAVRKPVLWPLLRQQPRFQKFLHKVVHFVLDDSTEYRILDELKAGGSYVGQSIQENQLWRKFLAYNEKEKFFEGNDLLGFADLDEVSYRNAVYYLKNCQMPSDPVDMGIWFPFGHIDLAFRSDFPVKGTQYTIGVPTFWTLNTLMSSCASKSQSRCSFRKHGQSNSFVLGGMHMSHYGYIPFQVAKKGTIIEGHGQETNNAIARIMRSVHSELNQISTLSPIRVQEAEVLHTLQTILMRLPSNLEERRIPISKYKSINPKEYQAVVQIPWFYNCNRKRYPSWEGKVDLRLLSSNGTKCL